MSEKTFSQRHFFKTTKFTFNEKLLDYSYRDLSGERGGTIDYIDIPLHPRKVVESSFALLTVCLVFILCTVLITYSHIDKLAEGGLTSNYGQTTLMFVTISFFWYFLYVANQRRFFVYPLYNGQNVLVLTNKNPDTIVNEIRHRTTLRWREKFLVVDDSINMMMERPRYQFMLDNKIITQDEYNKVLRTAQSSLQALGEEGKSTTPPSIQ